ncbi:MAG: Ig-like domain-containing protein [Ignavibacteriae bacterium]|nr:Ig-like domain-containing protein [Ignavibacteriota bacterium]
MASFDKVKKIIVRFIILIFIISGCANPQAPSGGPPDKTPPIITEQEPAKGTLNFSGKAVTINFNKYMDKNKVNENVFISPDVPFSLDWSGKELEIEFTDTLSANTTYSLTLGTEYTDLHQNKPAEAFSMIFSTGNTLDSGIIKGRLYDKEPSGVFIFCYKIDGINPDTLNPTHTKPYSRIQVGTSGNFEFHALKDGLYRLIAVRDKFKDGIYDNGMDDFGACGWDINLRQDSSEYISMKIGPAIDQIAPILNGAEAISNRRILLEFSEPIDTLSIDTTLFIISDSLNRLNTGIISANISTKGANYIELLSNNELDTATKWFVKVKTGIKDTVGNSIPDTNNKSYFYSIDEKDTLLPKIIYSPFKDSTFSINPEQTFDFIFNCAIERNIADKIRIHMPEGSKDIPFDLTWKDGNHISVKPKQVLVSDNWYTLTFDLSGIKSTNGYIMKDSTLKLRFKTKDIRSFGGITGTIKGNELKNEKYIINLISKDKIQYYTSQIENDGKWEFKNIPPGFYTLEVYVDKDNSGKHSFGKPFPFIYSEKFYVFEKEYEIKPRWKVEDLILTLP